TAPTNLSATATSAFTVALAWQPSTDNVGVVSYRVLRNGAAVGTSSTNSYADSGLTPATTYTYSVIALDAAGNASAASSTAQATTPAASGNVIPANPSNYLSLLPTLKPGDTLLLAAGDYGIDANGNDTASVPGLPIFNLNGTASAPITITGPETGPKPVFYGRSTHNTIRFANASFIVVRNVEVNGRNRGGFGVAVQGPTQHITLEGLRIHGVGDDQQTVGISTTGWPTWNWVIRRNVIENAGTGMYLGDSTGGSPFVAGLIEHNLIVDSIGYNLQIKHQTAWPAQLPDGMPTGKTNTVIRHNVFVKRSSYVSPDGPRPNLLVGDQPPSGPGSENGFEIYGNFFYQNPTEALFQGEGNIAFYGNLMVNHAGTALRVQRHNGVVRNVRIFGNTIVAGDTGIAVSGGASGFTQQVLGNAVFAATPISVSGSAASATGNVTDGYANASTYLNNPTGALGALDLYPRAGQLRGSALDTAGLTGFTDFDRDFNGAARDWALRGAYSGDGTNPGWRPKLEIKP
ncbi:MAG TPA: fibronectin type III domain-containing protein, partial [Burkholderiaceae bacterium]|nr:fibronectin type III domain-containing protein [Burkholderiaceae bacterium]